GQKASSIEVDHGSSPWLRRIARLLKVREILRYVALFRTRRQGRPGAAPAREFDREDGSVLPRCAEIRGVVFIAGPVDAAGRTDSQKGAGEGWNEAPLGRHPGRPRTPQGTDRQRLLKKPTTMQEMDAKVPCAADAAMIKVTVKAAGAGTN